MNVKTKYFMNMIKSSVPKMACVFVFKNFWVDKYGRRIWLPEDKTASIPTKKVTIVGVKALFPVYINAATQSSPIARSKAFDYNWEDYGEFRVSFTMVKYGPWLKCLDSVFTQMLMLVDQGFNIFLGTCPLIKKNTSYEHLMNIDIMDVVE